MNLRLLILEDQPLDAELMVRALEASGLKVPSRRVETEAAFAEALDDPPDLILTDFSLPQWNMFEALDLVKRRGLNIPMIVVTGSIGEERAVECMKRGAADYVLKDRLGSLPAAIEGALRLKSELEHRQQLEDGLRRSEAKFRNLLESAPDAILVVAEDGTITMVNSQAELTFGYTRAELVGQPIHVLVPERHQARHPELVQDYVSAPVVRPMGMQSLDLFGRRKDGTEFPVEISLSPSRTDGHLFVTSIVRDVSERKTLERQNRQLQKVDALGQLAGGVAHDFNNLLTVILGYAGKLKKYVSDDTASKWVQGINDTALSASSLTRQLLAFSSKQVVEFEPLCLSTLVDDTKEMLARLIPEDIEVVTVPDSTATHIMANQGQAEQILVNLSLNARDAMEGGGCLTIETTHSDLGETDTLRRDLGLKTGSYVVLSVEDTGTGIDTQTLDHIFDPFFTTKKVGMGTGLGLSTVYGIVKQAGGAIRVTSEVGSGTRFSIYLPQVAGPESNLEVPHVKNAAAHINIKDMTVLVAEDDRGILEFVRDVLEENGYTVLTAGRGDEALQILQNYAKGIDLLLTDLHMPGLRGDQVEQESRSIRPGIQTIIMSGSAGTSPAGMPHRLVLPKPFTDEDLLAKVYHALTLRSEPHAT